MTGPRRIGRYTWFAVRAIAAGVVFSRLARAARTAPPVRPTVTPLGSISVVVPARDEAAPDRPAARAHGRCARRRRGDRGRRRLARRDGRALHTTRCPGRRRRRVAARMGRQGVGARAGSARGDHRVGRHPRCRHPPRPVVGDRARGPRRGRAPRPPDGGRSVRLPDGAVAVAARGDAHHARVPVRAAGQPVRAGRTARWRTDSAWWCAANGSSPVVV